MFARKRRSSVEDLKGVGFRWKRAICGFNYASILKGCLRTPLCIQLLSKIISEDDDGINILGGYYHSDFIHFSVSGRFAPANHPTIILRAGLFVDEKGLPQTRRMDTIVPSQ
jgi:hypothetical protein